jgi:hypothetical protein
MQGRLTHEQTLEWIDKNRAWRRAKKTQLIWVREVEQEERDKDYLTAEGTVQRPQEGYWLCVGVVGEPWFQRKERIYGKYEQSCNETKQFAFDARPFDYLVFKPKGDVRNWAAQVSGPGLIEFSLKPNYDPSQVLLCAAGGYVVTDDVPDPYQGILNDVWIVQRAIFESSYELLT